MITTNMFLTDYGLNIPAHYYWYWDLIYFISYFGGILLAVIIGFKIAKQIIYSKHEYFWFIILLVFMSIYSFLLLIWMIFCIDKSIVFLN